jgi:hypothetical protein
MGANIDRSSRNTLQEYNTMDDNRSVLEVQRSERERSNLSDLGLNRITPINPYQATEEFLIELWNNLASQDYAFDDFTRGDMKQFLAGMLDPGSLHFSIDTRGYIVVRNLHLSDNAYLHYAIWDKTMKFNEILQCGYEVVNFLFSQLKAARITASIPAYNTNAAKFATMLGFKFEGEIRNGIVFHEKHYHVRLYGILHSEWLNSRYNHARRTKHESVVDINNLSSSSYIS